MSKATDAQRKALGKGLSALLPQRTPQTLSKTSPKEVLPPPESSQSSRSNLEARVLPIDAD